MNKSLEFINKRLAEQNEECILETDEDISIYHLADFFKSKDPDAELKPWVEMEINNTNIIVEMTQANSDFSNFDFYGYHIEHNDGTLFFVYSAVERIVKKLLTLYSCPINKIKGVEDLIGVKKIKIKVGDIIVSQKDDKSPDTDRPWMTNKLEVFIPAYFELIKE